MAQLANNLPEMCETWVRSLDQEDPLEEEITLQYPCLENSMDWGAWWATVLVVTKSWTQQSDWAWTHTQRLKMVIDCLTSILSRAEYYQ